MDLPLYARILWKRRWILALGVLVAVLLAITAYYRIGFDGGVPKLTPRSTETWQSQANVFLTEEGFPAGSRAQYENAARFTGLATLYARLAEGDELQELIEEDGKLPGELQAAPAIDTTAGAVPLPIISLFGKSPTASGAEQVAARGLDAFLSYVATKQAEAGIPERQRIEFRVLNAPQPAILIDPRKKTLPVVVFLAVMIAAVAVVFILENASRQRSAAGLDAVPELRPRDTVRRESSDGTSPPPVPQASREQLAARSPDPEPEPESQPVRRWA
jgi:hypothetical protein